MEPFSYRQGDLYCENVRAEDIAQRFGTPTLVYSADALAANAKRYQEAFAPLNAMVCFAVKACPNVGCLRRIAAAGLGMCAASGTDLERAWLSGAATARTIFAGVGKTDDELRAALDGIYSPLFQAGFTVEGRPPYYRGPVGWFVAESVGELERIGAMSKALRINCRVAVRVRLPGIAQPPPHAKLPGGGGESKFGLPISAVREVFETFREAPNMRVVGLHTHLGTSLHEPARYGEAARVLVRLAGDLRREGHAVELISLGGGFASLNVSTTVPTPEDYAAAIGPSIAGTLGEGTTLAIEPGRAIVAAAGCLLVRVLDAKPLEDRLLLITDGGVNPSGRPHDSDGLRVVWPTRVRPGQEPPRRETQRIDMSGMSWCDVAGPTAWDGDAIACGRLMPTVKAGDVLAVFAAGAYPHHAFATDHSTPLPAEVLVDGMRPTLTRTRRSLFDRLGPEVDAIQAMG